MKYFGYRYNGYSETRTRVTLARSPVFKTGAFDHSADFTDFV